MIRSADNINIGSSNHHKEGWNRTAKGAGKLRAVDERRVGPNKTGIKMTTAAPLGNNTLSPTNVTTKSQEEILYQSSGAIVAAIVVGLIIIFTVVLLMLKTYNRHMRAKRELEPTSTKAKTPPTFGQNSSNANQPTTVTIVPVDIHMQNR
ncbi:noncompact myelin-associated protein [Terrapene carolina triunguis]|nr:noncompact myelin-associated protein [Terrapene carolina triunguis]